MLKDQGKPQPLNVRGGEFLITPDSQTLAIAKGEGIALLPLKPGANPLDFLPKFGRVLSFSRDGRAAAMVNYNTDNAKLKYTRSLFYVNNQGIQKEQGRPGRTFQDTGTGRTGPAGWLYALFPRRRQG